MRRSFLSKEYEDVENTVTEDSSVSPDVEPMVSGQPKTGSAVKGRYVRVRKNPSGSAQVVTVMNLGDTAKVLERIPGYYKIETHKDGKVGYVDSNYFQED